MPEKSLGLKQGEEKTPSGDDRPQTNAHESASEIEELEGSIDKTLTEGGSDDDLGIIKEDDDTVVLPKSKFERLKKNHDNYKNGLLSVKDKFKNLKRGAAEPAKPNESERKPDEKPVKNPNEGMAISQLTDAKLPTGRENPDYNKDIDENWAEILPYYTPRRGTVTQADIVKDIMDAYTLFRHDNPKEDADTGRETTAIIASENGAPAGEKPDGKKPTERKHILPTQTSAQSWYPTPK